jgi:pilus assembly protein Flp/PilA
MAGFLARFLKNRSGATAIEYGLIAVLIAVAIISGATAIGSSVNNMLSVDANKVTAAGS